MSLIALATLIGTCSLILVVFGLVSQTLEQKRAEQRRNASLLHRRISQFIDLQAHCPEGFLGQELETFLCMGIIENTQRLALVDPSAKGYGPAVAQCHNRLQALRANKSAGSRLVLKTPQQIRDTKACVNDIANIVANQVNSGSLSLQQGNALKQLLTRLMVLINLDSYQLAADQAEAAGKLQVALHYHQQAKKLFSTQKGLDQQADLKQHAMAIDQHINRLNETISKQSSDLIKRELDEKEKLRQQQADATEPGNSRINDEAQWKKKQVYD